MEAVLFAMLFGSQASGAARAGSDIDVAVYLDPALSARARFDLRVAVGGAITDLGEPDVLVLNDAPPLAGHQALMGKLLFARDPADYVRYFVRTVSASCDERPYRELHARARRRRLEEGTFGRP